MKFGIVSSTLLLAVSAVAQAQSDEQKERIDAALKGLAPNLEITSVTESPLPGLFEVVAGANVIYVSGDGRYLMQGSLFDMESRTDLTEQSKSLLRRDLIAGVDADRQIHFTAENPKHEVVVFTDIDCGYCRRLHQQMAEYNENGISVNYMFFPRAGVGSKSFEKAVSVWCAADRQEALTEAKAGSDPEPQSCSNPIEEHFQLGRSIGVTGTPAMVTADGTMIPGYVPPETLVQRLDALESGTAASAK